MRYLVLILVIFASCSTQSKLIRKQKRVNKLEFQIEQLKKELNLPLDSTIINVDTFVLERKIIKRDTVKLKCDSFNRVVFLDDQELDNSEIIYETEYIDREIVVKKNVEKKKKEIVYIEKKLNNKQLALIAIGFVTVLIGLMYVIGFSAGWIIKLLINKKNLV